MTISGVSSTSGSFTPQTNNIRDTFNQLADAIQSGDLATAKQAYTALTQANPNLLTSSPLSQDFSALGQALQSGDVTAAQQALNTLEADAQKLGGGHHHHHHGHRAGAAQSSTQVSAQAPTPAPNPTANTTATTSSTSGTAAIDGSTFTFTV